MADGRLYIDADACPVKAEAERVAVRLGVRMVLVSDGGIRPSANPLVESVYVAQGLDAADRWITAQAGAGDVVVTADIPLAAACVARGARVVTHGGEEITARNAGERLAARDLMADLRSADPFRQGKGRSFSQADRSRFLNTLDRVLRAAARDAAGRDAAGRDAAARDAAGRDAAGTCGGGVAGRTETPGGA